MPKNISSLASFIALMLFIGLAASAQLPGIPIPGVGVPGGPGVPPIPDNLLYEYPNPYANRAVSYRSVYLFKKEELEAGFSGAKILYGIAFDVQDQQGALLRDFTISLAEVDFDEMHPDSLNQNFSEVFSRPGYTETPGLNAHAFDIPYCYSGEKNLLIQICVQNFADERSFNAGTSTSFPDSVFNYSYHDWSNESVDLCNTVGENAEVYLNRPVTYFYANPVDVTDFRAKAASNPSGLELINSTHTPEITIQNFSCDTWTNYEIGYQIEGQPAHIETPGIPMVPGQYQTFQFNTPLTLDSGGFFEIKYWVHHNQDNVPQNDTLTRLTWVRKNKFEGLDYTGTDFWVGFMQNFSNVPALKQQLFITGLDTGDVTVSMPALGWSQNFSILPFQVVTVDVPVQFGGYTIANDQKGVVQPTGIQITATAEISVNGLSQSPQSSDGFLAIPTPSLGRDYFAIAPIGTYFPLEVNGVVMDELPAEILLVGTEDGTNAQVVLANPANGLEAGDTLSVNLNQGETFLIKAKVDRFLGAATGSYDLTGSRIISNHKIVVYGGSQCANIPGADELTTCQYCDHIMEEMTPTSTWGNSYYLTDFAQKPGEDIIRITGGDFPNTTVNVNGTVYVLNGPGDFVDHRFTGNAKILATNPVQVVQMCTGGQCFPISSTDPFFVNALPDVQWGSNYTFTTVVSDYFPFHYINVIKRATEGRVAIDGNLITPNLFSPIAGGDYMAAKLAVTAGTHMVTSDTTISVSVYGFGRDDGYGYPASGARLRPVNVEPPLITGVTTDISCFKYWDGTIAVEGDLGTPPYQFIWNDGFIGPQRDSLPAGTYVCTLIDDYGFSARDTFEILEADSFFVAFNIDSISCNGNGDGAIEVHPFGGTQPYLNGLWSTGSVNNRIENLFTGTYSYSLEDSKGCEVRDSVLLTEPEALRLNASTDSVLCHGEQNGAAQFTPTGGTTPFSVEVFDNQGNVIAPNALDEGTHPVRLSDNKGCQLDSIIEIFEPDPLLLDIQTVPSGCLDIATGEVFLTGSGGNGAFNYAFNNGTFSEDSLYGNLTSGNYPVAVQDANGCRFNNLAEVSTVPVPGITVSVTPDYCELNVGTGVVEYNGGTAPYNAQWILDGDTTAGVEVDSLPFGTYTVIAEDRYCKETLSATINPTDPPRFTVEAVQPSCGLNNGKLFIDVNSSNGPYRAEIQSGQQFIGDSISELAAGNYTVTVFDEACAVPFSLYLDSIPELKLDSVHVIPAHCDLDNGAGTIFVSGGVAPYEYTWLNNNHPAPTNEDLQNGSYEIEVEDALCTKTFEIEIPRLTLPNVNFDVTPTRCNSNIGEVTANFSGGSGVYSFLWEHNQDSTSQQQTNLDSGTYVIAYNDGYCFYTDSTFVSRTDDFSVSAHVQPTHCDLADGSVSLQAVPGNGNYTYTWDNYPDSTSNILNNLDTGLYAVTVSDGQCQFNLNYQIPKTALPNVNANATPATCGDNNGTISFNATSSTGFVEVLDSLDQPVPNTLLGLSGGLYRFKAFDGFCYADTAIRVVVPEPLRIDSTITAESCDDNNGTISFQLYGSGDVEILWGDNFSTNPVRNNLDEGSYPFEVNDDYCQISGEVIIREDPEAPLILSNAKLDATCGESNGYLNVQVSGPESPYNISWNQPGFGSNLELENLSPGVYFLTVSGTVCSETQPFVIGEIPALEAQFERIKNADCDEASGAVVVSTNNASGPLNYVLGNDTIALTDTLQNLPAGQTTVTIIDDLCAVDLQIDIPLGEDLTYTLDYSDENCSEQDGFIHLDNIDFAGDQYNLAWNDNSNLEHRNNLTAGTYSFVISDSLCEKSETIHLINNPAPSGDLTIIQSEACAQQDGIARFENIQNTDGFTWNNGVNNQVEQQNLSAGTVWVMASNNFCSRRFEANLPATLAPIFNTQSDADYCSLNTGRILFNPIVDAQHQPYQIFELGTGMRINDTQLNGLPGGSYGYQIVDNRNCRDTGLVEIANAIVSMNDGSIIVVPEPLVQGSDALFGAALPAGWSENLWDFGSFTVTEARPVIEIDSDSLGVTLYTQHQTGCTDSLFRSFVIKPTARIYIPNSFTPNGDGLNDGFAPVVSDIKSWRGQIFNRWGEMIYEFNSNTSAWDGTYMGNDVKPGVYPTVFYYTDLIGIEHKVEAMVTLIR